MTIIAPFPVNGIVIFEIYGILVVERMGPSSIKIDRRLVLSSTSRVKVGPKLGFFVRPFFLFASSTAS